MELRDSSRDLINETRMYVYNFRRFETIRSFAKNIFAGKITLNDSDKDKKKNIH